MGLESQGCAVVVEGSELGPAPLPPRNATLCELQAAETFCLGKPQECGETEIEQVLECMRAFMWSLTKYLLNTCFGQKCWVFLVLLIGMVGPHSYPLKYAHYPQSTEQEAEAQSGDVL